VFTNHTGKQEDRAMKLTVFGASGGIGTELVRQGLDAGHHVTAVVREASRLAVEPHPNLKVVVADVMDPAAIAPAVAGREAVLSALGTRVSGPTTVNSDGARSIIQAMQDAGVRRLLMVSVAGIHTKGDDPFTRFVVKPILGRILRHSFADVRQMETLVRNSGLDWSLVCPPRLTNGKRSGKVRSNAERNVRGGFTIARADVAAYLLGAVKADEVVGATVSVAG
jgi:putative NADH-flavin reductase